MTIVTASAATYYLSIDRQHTRPCVIPPSGGSRACIYIYILQIYASFTGG